MEESRAGPTWNSGRSQRRFRFHGRAPHQAGGRNRTGVHHRVGQPVGVQLDWALCASPDYLKQNGTPAHPSDLRQHNCLTYGFLSTGNQWKLTGKDGDHWIQPSWTLCANNAEVLCDAAVKGCGIALLPVFIAEHALTDGALRSILSDYKAPPLTLYAIYPPTRHLALKVRLFIDFLVAHIK